MATAKVSTVFLFLLVGSILVSPAGALEYQCPSDPGFCYRDFGDDGCFDSGVDDGPINTEIEDSDEFPPVPPPGSIVCPPSVGELTAAGANIRLATEPGSSILIYAARMKPGFRFEAMSGGDLLVGGPVFGGVALSAMNQVYLEERVKRDNIDAVLESLSGDVIIGPKAKVNVDQFEISAVLGNVVLLEGVVVKTKDGPVEIVAAGDVEMTRPKIRAAGTVSIEAANVSLHEKGQIKTDTRVLIDASPGDVTFDRVTLTAGAVGFTAPITISGTNITIGVAQNGKVPRSRLTYKGDDAVEILATDAIEIDSLRLDTMNDTRIETSGTVVDLQRSILVGRNAMPTIEVAAGPGSTCDLTGTLVQKATLVTSCDTVIGP